MAGLHPFFVHFPIALLVCAAFFDLNAVLRKEDRSHFTAYLLQSFAGISAVLAGFSGNLAESGLREAPVLVESLNASIETHISWGNAMVWVIVIFVVGRTFAILEKKSWAKSGWLFPIISSVLAGLILITGFLGGDLSQAILDFYISN